MKKSTDVTEEYINRATPNKGNIQYEDGYQSKNHEEEIDMADWLHDNLGGDILLLAETGATYGAKRPESIDSAVRKAIGQIYDNPGGIILNFEKNKVTMSRIELAVKSRIDANCRFKMDVMIVCDGKLQKVIRYT